MNCLSKKFCELQLLLLTLTLGCQEAAHSVPNAAVVAAAAALPPAAVTAASPGFATPALEIATAGEQNQLSRAELDAGWVKLFDGYTLFGWSPNSDNGWRVVEGAIVSGSETKGLLLTTSRFANYELRCDFFVDDGGNSGLFLRTPREPKNPAVDCYELNVCDTHAEFKSGSLVGRGKPPVERALNNGWHTYTVKVDKRTVAIGIDGEPWWEYQDESERPLQSGHIGLQMNGGVSRFRNVFLRPLGLTSMWNGTNLEGWHVVPGSALETTINAEGLRLKGGRGFLESDATAGDFVLAFAARTNAENVNSGVFFRSMRGTEKDPANGYEFQVNHQIVEGDRNRPADSGTGAIFRCAAARRVVTTDRAWCTCLLVADGPHFATWVDGISMVDWTDERNADPNPRKGLRVEPGHLLLQGHDPGSDVTFRSVMLAPLP